MTNKYNREFLLEYVESENKKNECNVSLENMNKIVSLIEYFGIELYRPITRLLLSNWEEITDRINNYTEGAVYQRKNLKLSVNIRMNSNET